ncbi:hypothetical protein PV327_008127 [Microctonus hyperodae]|uniref:Uncharacterized protein n=1 Tax=Microctonus hyperodae TaxID=165561 RepID=A0AA39KGL2_MICHY|nr:hypothetical protein PV327_008127 [Microctonus hyperodae]
MDFAYVGILFLGCMLQILIGSSHGLPDASSCSTITCGINEQSKENDDNTFSCICLPKYYRSDTQKCELKYQWVELTHESWEDTRLVHYDPSQKNYVITRLVYGDDNKVPYEGEINIYDKIITPYLQTDVADYKRLEILLVDAGNYKWVQSSNGAVLDNAIEGGLINNEVVYLCRVFVAKIHYAGVMKPSTGHCSTIYAWMTEKSTYELLIFDK